MKKFFVALLSLVCVVMIFTACSDKKPKVVIAEPTNNVSDRIYPAMNENAIEDSNNVNGKRFTLSLEQFSKRYNKITADLGDSDLLKQSAWKKNGAPKEDSNGVQIQYYYYNEDGVNFTATVEVGSNRVMNIGCGTTMGNFVAESNGENNSDKILRKSAIMAQAICQFPMGSTDTLQDIFYRSTMEEDDSFWYQGFVFTMSVTQNKEQSENSIMLLRVFPVDENLKDDWKIIDYEEYIATAPVEETQFVTYLDE